MQVQVENTKVQKLNEEATEMRKSKLLDNLPEHVFPILEGKILKGYYVEGLMNIPRKDFCQNLNHHNLRQATKFIETVKNGLSTKHKK